MDQNKGIVIAVFLVTVVVTTLTLIVPSLSNHQGVNAVEIKKTIVHAGGGNSTNLLAAYVPQRVQISPGQSVTWDNPSVVAEPHTVTFVFNNKTMTAPDVPFTVRNSTQFSPVPPGANSQPNIIPGKNGMNIIIVSNARGYYPTLLGSNGHAKVLGPNGNLTITGNELYVSSGWLVPKGQEKAFPGSSTTFTVTFQKMGTYNYICLLHPWMTGSVVVK